MYCSRSRSFRCRAYPHLCRSNPFGFMVPEKLIRTRNHPEWLCCGHLGLQLRRFLLTENRSRQPLFDGDGDSSRTIAGLDPSCLWPDSTSYSTSSSDHSVWYEFDWHLVMGGLSHGRVCLSHPFVSLICFSSGGQVPPKY